MNKAIKWPVVFVFMAGSWVFVYQVACILLWGQDEYEGYTWVVLNVPVALVLASIFAAIHIFSAAIVGRKSNKHTQAIVVITVDIFAGLAGFAFFGLTQHSWVNWALPFLVACLISVGATMLLVTKRAN